MTGTWKHDRIQALGVRFHPKNLVSLAGLSGSSPFVELGPHPCRGRRRFRGAGTCRVPFRGLGGCGGISVGSAGDVVGSVGTTGLVEGLGYGVTCEESDEGDGEEEGVGGVLHGVLLSIGLFGRGASWVVSSCGRAWRPSVVL